MAYNIEEHTHRFAIWTAARAVQRNFTTTEIIKAAIENGQLREKLNDLYQMDLEEEQYDNFHRKIATNLMSHLPSATYGRAAKIIAIYIKTFYVIRFPESRLSRVAHPPIDAILLRNIQKHLIPGLKKYTWTKLSQEDYFELIDKLRALQFPYFWMLEKCWQPTDSKEEPTFFA